MGRLFRLVSAAARWGRGPGHIAAFRRSSPAVLGGWLFVAIVRRSPPPPKYFAPAATAFRKLQLIFLDTQKM